MKVSLFKPVPGRPSDPATLQRLHGHSSERRAVAAAADVAAAAECGPGGLSREAFEQTNPKGFFGEKLDETCGPVHNCLYTLVN